jgi:3-oxoadipate enol-lactonase
MTTIRSGYASVENGELYYEVTGEGRALLLIHAGVADHTMWEPQLEPFSRSHTVITYDTRGFGISRITNGSFSNRQDIRDLLNHLGIDRATLIGNSRAGQIAIDTALEYPEIVSAVVWICGGISGSETEPSKAEMDAIKKMEALWEAHDWDALSDLEADYWVNGPGQPADRAPAHVRNKVRDMTFRNNTRQDGEGEPRPLQPPAAGRLSELGMPVLAVIGDLDEAGTQENADLLAAKVPNARKVVFHNAGHMVSMERPDEFNELVLDFLTQNNL